MVRPTVPADGATGWGQMLRDAIFAVSDSTDSKVAPSTIPVQFSSGTAVIGISPSDKAYVARTLTGARMRVNTAPVGSSLIAQVQHYNGTAWVTVSTLTITTGSVVEASTSFTQVQTIGQLTRLNVTSVGSTTAATGVVVDVLWA